MRRSRPLLSVLAACGAALALAAPASADWTLQPVSTTYPGARGSISLVGNARGDVALAWKRRYGSPTPLQLALARRGGPLGAPRTVPGSRNGLTPTLDMNARGDVLVVYRYEDFFAGSPFDIRDEGCCLGAKAVVFSKDGRFGPARALTRKGRDVYVEGMEIDPHGRMAVAWKETRHDRLLPDLFARFARSDGRLGRRVRVAHQGNGVTISVVHGRARVLFVQHRKGESESRLYERGVGVKRARGRARLVAPGLPRSAGVAGAANARGKEVVAFEDAHRYDRPVDIYAGVRGVARTLHAVRVSTAGAVPAPHVAIGPSGAAALAWGAGAYIVTAVRPPGRPFGAASVLAQPTSPTSTSYYPSLGVDSSGNAALAWVHSDGVYGEHTVVRAAFRRASGEVADLQDLSAPTYTSNVFQTAGATLNASGGAWVAWRRSGDLNAARSQLP